MYIVTDVKSLESIEINSVYCFMVNSIDANVIDTACTEFHVPKEEVRIFSVGEEMEISIKVVPKVKKTSTKK